MWPFKKDKKPKAWKYIDPHGYKKKYAWHPTLVECYDNSFHKVWIQFDWYEEHDHHLLGGSYETIRRSLNPELTIDNCRKRGL